MDDDELHEDREDEPMVDETYPCKFCNHLYRECECGKYKMPFGKYKGWTIAAVFDDNEDYLEWMIDNLDPGDARDAAEGYLEKQ